MADRFNGFPPDESNPWLTRSVRKVYDNPWIQVEEHQVVRPDGSAGIYGIVRPTHLAIGIVPIEGDHVWLVGQFRYPLGHYSWEIPEGGGDPGKGLEAEAARELAEETGLIAGSWTHLLTLHTSNCFTSERAEIFIAEELSPGEASPDASEQLQTARVPLGDALQAIREGRITDAMTVAALLQVARLRDI